MPPTSRHAQAIIFDVYFAYGGKSEHFTGTLQECVRELHAIAHVHKGVLRSWFRHAALERGIGRDVPFKADGLEGSIIFVSGGADEEEFIEPYDPSQMGDTDDDI